ncbi:MAG: alpha/beta hydrolase [Betaproteobacteria bacterium]|nr:alpha/beta hydrolase [Betaproteobacteria bacterium]
MPYATVNGQRVYFRDSGGPGPALVFCHGLLMDGSMFEPQVKCFRDEWRCITWDQRGHGRTAGEGIAALSYDDSADDLAALMNHLAIEHAVVAGMSQGGHVALRLALTHPRLVRGLVLLNTQALPENDAAIPIHKEMLAIWTQDSLPETMAGSIACIILGEGAPQAQSWKAKWHLWRSPNLIASFQALMDRDDISGCLGSIQVPALVIHGNADAAITLERSLAMQRLLADARMAVIAGAGHASNLTHASQVNARMGPFLQRTRADWVAKTDKGDKA